MDSKGKAPAAEAVKKTTKKVTLRSSDGGVFEVEEEWAKRSEMIKHLIEDVCTGDVIPVPNVTSAILALIIDYCRTHSELADVDCFSSGDRKEKLRRFDEEFVKVDKNTLFELIVAANYLDIKSLLDLTCQEVANMMRGKSPEQIRTLFNIDNDYTPEEEEEVRMENQWAFQ